MSVTAAALACKQSVAGTCEISGSTELAYVFVIVGAVIGILFGIFQYMKTAAIILPSTEAESASLIEDANSGDEHKNLLTEMRQNAAGDQENTDVTHGNFIELIEIWNAVTLGAQSFLAAQYSLCIKFTIVFSLVVFFLCSKGTELSGNKIVTKWEWETGALTAVSFAVGAFTSIIAGYIGMTVAVFANARVTVEAVKPGAAGWRGSFNAAFIAGSVMGFALCGLALIVLYILIMIYTSIDGYDFETKENAKKLFECVAGYGLGGSSMALFGRVGGGIVTKAADVGADLSGKVAGVTVKNADGKFEQKLLDEDSPLNPATIADNVGDNVGDVAGMGSDLFGSFAEATCAALVISTSSEEIASVGAAAYMFPLIVSACGIVMCMLTSFVATHIQTVAEHKDVECVLKVQLFVSALLMTICTLPMALLFLPNDFQFQDLYVIEVEAAGTPPPLATCHAIGAWVCVICGLWGGCLIGFITEYYTSHSYTPVKEVAASCESGAATNIIYGLALGYLSCILPITLLAINVYVAFSLCGMYGVALAALGMLGTLSTCLSIDVYGPIADNAGGLAEMAEFPKFVRHKTDALDAAGNTTAAIGKGFAIGSAALVSLALFGGFVSRLAAHSPPAADNRRIPVVIDVLRPITFAFLFLGAMLPYWFTAYCMKSVGMAAAAMVQNVKEQFSANGGQDGQKIYDGKMKPDYQQCIDISTKASLKEMVAPAMLVMGAPILTGAFFGVEAVSGLLVGALISAVQLAISQSNSGGAWDNAKKYVESGGVTIKKLITAEFAEDHPEYAHMIGQEVNVVQAKKTEVHQSAVVGDTVGDPLKDTSGPALNIVMKLMAILSLVFSDFFVSMNDGRGIFNIATSLNLSCTAGGACPTP
jgi:inorganic pyrophosphatase